VTPTHPNKAGKKAMEASHIVAKAESSYNQNNHEALTQP
jgi:hypothetical protein